MKKLKSIVAVILALVMALALFGCASGKTEPEPEESSSAAPSEEPSAETPESPDANEEYPSYNIGFTALGSGYFILDEHLKLTSHYIGEACGMTLNSLSANFSSDQMIKDIQNQISSGEQGHIYVGAFATLTPSVSELFNEAGIYWGSYSQMIQPEMFDVVNADPYYVGSVGSDNYTIAASLAQQALDMGNKKALILAGALGDAEHDVKVASFTEVFEAGGGEVLGVARCSDPSEAFTKFDDLVAAYGADADCVYAINTAFSDAVLVSLENLGIEGITCYASDLDEASALRVLEGNLVGGSNLALASPYLGALVINAIDGHAILNEEGNAPWLDIVNPFIITEDNAQDYIDCCLYDYPLQDDDFASLLYRNNPDADYDYFVNYIEGVDYDYIMSTRNG